MADPSYKAALELARKEFAELAVLREANLAKIAECDKEILWLRRLIVSLAELLEIDPDLPPEPEKLRVKRRKKKPLSDAHADRR
jgi:hypothetical protein